MRLSVKQQTEGSMKILIYGAGVISCELAHMLCKKSDVTLLARGKWKEVIDANGTAPEHFCFNAAP